MTPSEIRAKELKELKKILEEKREALFHLKLKALTGQLAKNHELGVARKDIARINTILKEREKPTSHE